MKNLLFLLLFIPTLSFGQIKKIENPKSNIENISDQAGVLLKKEFIDLGKVSGVQIQIYRLTNLSTNVTTSGIRFEYYYSSSYSTDTKIGVLDADELDGLIKSIETMQAKIFDSIPNNYTEVAFHSRSGFEAGCFVSKEKWETYLKLEKYDGDSEVFMTKDDFNALLEILKNAKTKL